MKYSFAKQVIAWHTFKKIQQFNDEYSNYKSIMVHLKELIIISSAMSHMQLGILLLINLEPLIKVI